MIYHICYLFLIWADNCSRYKKEKLVYVSADVPLPNKNFGTRINMWMKF
jgi:hypothetical protein